jgi:hypothetical protein
VRDEYLWHGPVVADTIIAGETERGANAPKGVVS